MSSAHVTTAKARPRRFETLEDRRMMAYTAMADVFGGTDGEYHRGDPAPAGYVSVVQEQNLNSRPGAPATLFLDFNGHYQTERVGMDEWQDFFVPGNYGWHNILTPAWDRDGDPLNFSPAEQQQIRFIWASVAEDYAPFNINVTTVDPDPGLYHTDGPYLRVVISGEANFTGNSKFSGGLGEYHAYANEDGANVAYVFGMSDGTLTNGGVRFLAEAASHEAGHTFGLVDHHDKNVGNDVRAPIMGEDSAYSSERGVWWDGDMDVIASSANGFGYRADDYGNSFASAAHLTSTNAGLYARGVVEWTTDVDMFQFSTGGGNVEIKVTLPTEADDIAHPSFPFARHRNVGNLDASLRLYNASGALVAQDSDPTLFASLTANLAAGTYYVQVGSYGLAGDVGQYSLFVNETTGPQLVGGTELWIIDPTASIPGDYNADDRVDGADFLLWQRGRGAAAVPSGSGADGNDNGIVDGPDLALWRENFGATSGPAASLAAPAPAPALTPAMVDAAMAYYSMHAEQPLRLYGRPRLARAR